MGGRLVAGAAVFADLELETGDFDVIRSMVHIAGGALRKLRAAAPAR
jgi:hypothetical protein